MCVAGRDPLGAALSAYEGRPIQGRELRLRRGLRNEELRACHVLYAAEADDRRVAAILRSVVDLPVLTVGDSDGFLEAGGMINLVAVDNRMQFEVNLPVVTKRGLFLSSQLLRLARSTATKGRP